MHKEGRITDATVKAVLVGRRVAFAELFDNIKEVILNVKLGLLVVGVLKLTNRKVAGEVITTGLVRRLTFT